MYAHHGLQIKPSVGVTRVTCRGHDTSKQPVLLKKPGHGCCRTPTVSGPSIWILKIAPAGKNLVLSGENLTNHLSYVHNHHYYLRLHGKEKNSCKNTLKYINYSSWILKVWLKSSLNWVLVHVDGPAEWGSGSPASGIPCLHAPVERCQLMPNIIPPVSSLKSLCSSDLTKFQFQFLKSWFHAAASETSWSSAFFHLPLPSRSWSPFLDQAPFPCWWS